ncbi:MAG: hypothetical protein E7035_00715 [Verrucomicrobiaceae bacterium]|nr:hypothetical protein [Verrucomicrobiaceae bacterium]
MKTNKYFENQPVDCSYFSGLLPEGQDWFSPKEIGAIIGRSDQYVRNTFYSGKIFGHLSNGLAKKGFEKKTYLRVHRSAIALYLAQSANYSTDDLIEALSQIIVRLSDYQLMRLDKVIKDVSNGTSSKKTYRK